MNGHRVVFTPSGLVATAEPGDTVLGVARRVGADLDSVCGGRGVCGRCQVLAVAGDFPKWGLHSRIDGLAPPGPAELSAQPTRPVTAPLRLGCLAEVEGDIVIDIPAESQVHRPVVSTDSSLAGVGVDPRVHPAYLDAKDLGVGAAGALPGRETLADRVAGALADRHGLEVAGFAPRALAELAPVLGVGVGGVGVEVPGQGGGSVGTGGVTVLVRTPAIALSGPEVIAVLPGYIDSALGVALDIGSTTIAGYLCDLGTGEILARSGSMNPQIRWGEDLMSRVSYVMMHPGGDRELTAAVRGSASDLVGALCAECGVDAARVAEVVVVANPVMAHLFLGWDPTPLGQAPFTLASDRPVTLAAADVELPLPHAQVYVAPPISGHVGGDAAGVLLAEGPHRSEHPVLVVDVGTNAEILLGSRSGVVAASSPTGPAFEGAQLSCGMRASAGAIERVRIDRDTLEPRVRVIGSTAWSDDPAFGAGAPPVVGVCGSGVVEAIGELFLAGVIGADGRFEGTAAERSPRIVAEGRSLSYVLWEGSTPVVLTQNDVRAVQLAKAALRGGIDLLMEHAGILETDLVDIRLAGAFGARLDPLYALLLGLIPDCPLEGVRAVGNSAGAGALRCLVSASERRELEEAVGAVTRVETATEPRFQELFVAAMALPHSIRNNPNLSTVVTLPDPVPRRRPARRGSPSRHSQEK